MTAKGKRTVNVKEIEEKLAKKKNELLFELSQYENDDSLVFEGC